MMLLALIVTIISVIQLTITLDNYILDILNSIDRFIYVVFIVDYFTRLVLSKNKWYFIKNNKLDLITIIPFNTIFISLRIVRFLRVTEFLKATKALRATIYINNFAKKIWKVLKTNIFYFVTLITIILIFSCAAFISIFENLKFTDSLWWSFVTATTVGYGDISPTTNLGRIVAVILMIVGVAFFGVLTGAISSFFLKKDIDRRKDASYESVIINDIKNRLDDFENISQNDLKDMFNLLYKLKSTEDKID